MGESMVVAQSFCAVPLAADLRAYLAAWMLAETALPVVTAAGPAFE